MVRRQHGRPAERRDGLGRDGELLLADAGSYTWVAATVGAQNAASYQLATEEPVIALGGFNGSDPAPTLEQFKEWVAQGKVHYFIGGGSFGSRTAAPRMRPTSPPGCRRTSPPRPSAPPPSTT